MFRDGEAARLTVAYKELIFRMQAQFDYRLIFFPFTPTLSPPPLIVDIF